METDIHTYIHTYMHTVGGAGFCCGGCAAVGAVLAEAVAVLELAPDAVAAALLLATVGVTGAGMATLGGVAVVRMCALVLRTHFLCK